MSEKQDQIVEKDTPVVKKENKGRSLSWAEIWELTKISFKEFFQGDSFMHGAALAYYTIFALICKGIFHRAYKFCCFSLFF